MAKRKKSKGKVIQMLSPENYIKKKARSLPIHKCWINKNWKSSGKCNIAISRKHNNNNISICHYLVDLYCLGIKDTHYQFNIFENEFLDFIRMKSPEEDYLIEIDYPTAHNIIYAALEYAEDLGFDAHKDFESLTEAFLEEDNDDIELIDIECGRNGRPCFISSDNDSEALVNRVMKQLEKAVGKDQFDFIDGTGYFNPETYEDFEDEEEVYAENNDFFHQLPEELKRSVAKQGLEDNLASCMKLYESKDNNDHYSASLLSNYILCSPLDKDDMDEDRFFQLDDYFDEIEILNDLPKEYYTEYKNQQSLFDDSASIEDELKEMTQQIELDKDKILALIEQNPNIPILYYFLLVNEEAENNKKIHKLTAKLFPEITLFKILKYLDHLSDNPKIFDIFQLHEKFFGQHKTLNELEVTALIHCFIVINRIQGHFEVLPFLEASIFESPLSDHFKSQLLIIILANKYSIISGIYNNYKDLMEE